MSKFKFKLKAAEVSDFGKYIQAVGVSACSNNLPEEELAAMVLADWYQTKGNAFFIATDSTFKLTPSVAFSLYAALKSYTDRPYYMQEIFSALHKYTMEERSRQRIDFEQLMLETW